jgi:hypothetical protein
MSSSYVVCGDGQTPVDQHIANTHTIWQLSAGDEKSIPAVKINIYRTGQLESFSIPGIDFSLHNPSKNAGSSEYSLGSTREYLIIYRGPGFLVVI